MKFKASVNHKTLETTVVPQTKIMTLGSVIVSSLLTHGTSAVPQNIRLCWFSVIWQEYQEQAERHCSVFDAYLMISKRDQSDKDISYKNIFLRLSVLTRVYIEKKNVDF